MKQVPLSGRVIFSDWHGVLSRDPFWVSIRSSATHPLHRQLEAGMAGVFASDRDIANEWMKGPLSSDQVIAEMGIQLDRPGRSSAMTSSAPARPGRSRARPPGILRAVAGDARDELR
jgi:hypothetical protein